MKADTHKEIFDSESLIEYTELDRALILRKTEMAENVKKTTP